MFAGGEFAVTKGVFQQNLIHHCRFPQAVIAPHVDHGIQTAEYLAKTVRARIKRADFMDQIIEAVVAGQWQGQYALV